MGVLYRRTQEGVSLVGYEPRCRTICLFIGGLTLMGLAGYTEASEFVRAANPPIRVTMDFRTVEIGRLFRIIEQASGLNIVVGREVRGRVTVHLTDVPWERALDSILRANGYGYVREGNIIRIDTREILRRERGNRGRRSPC